MSVWRRALLRPDEGARKQIEIYRRMSGRQRLAIAFEMWEAALAMARASEKALNPHLSEYEIEVRARKRMTDGEVKALLAEKTLPNMERLP